MKIAIVHDWFNTKVGGAERVAIELAKMFPDAPVFTLIYNHQKFGGLIDGGRIQTSFLQKFPRTILDRPKILLPLIPRAVGSLDLSGYDMVISSSFGFVKNITTPAGCRHICYCHSPMRFAWDYRDKYMDDIGLGKLAKTAANITLKQIRCWDLKGNDGVDVWLANSKTVAQRIKKYYHQSSQVVYPPAETSGFKPVSSSSKKDFYLTMGMLTPYKKINLVVEAANQGGWELKVLGDGPQRAELEKLAGKSVEILGYVSESNKKRLLAKARGLIFPNEEDFGIAPVEAMAAGTPVIAYARGGLKETVIANKTGIFFNTQSPQAINQAIKNFEQHRFKTADLIARAKDFDASHFRKAIFKIVKDMSHV